ncbi:hypothetical protein CVS30_15085 [Arthrobacter psychrolactophilus]|uniref:Glycoside hydrolase family 127 protein n=1 Tax=Arthrobacter psychrolactophilus TaxID=92442 RepID=A0A2V5JDV2_9MICC|nr:beta-L-arabinofuranosidase domain-containing protein [Arthrobacter psychrolactophilus]PYI37467.1 hypothetical protein CVS30_15085 [Arthrobacter psychrolactophilus]
MNQTSTTRNDSRPVSPSATQLVPLSLSQARLGSSGFWGTRSRINAENTLEHCLRWQERAGWLPNFDLAASGKLPAGRQGREFSDSEIYKLLEGYCWESETHPSDDIEAIIASITARLVAAQESDGYLNTKFGRPEQGARYSNLEWGHELYNYGHLLQAAVARLRTHGEDALVALARRVADHICETFGPDGIQSVCGHAEIELGLMEFARATGEGRYLEQARLFIERRGHHSLADIELGRDYFQDDLPVRERTVLAGHAVRALYFAAAVVDLAVETGDEKLLAAVEHQWENTVATRTYITGGMGSHHTGEAFGEDFVLPSDRAYCESCAGVASVMLSWRLLLATGKARYADLIERTLFNIVATASSDDGRSFFYANTLHRRNPGVASDPNEQSKRADSSQRAAWFDVACCPTNIARTLSSLGAYLATVDDNGIQVHQFADADVCAEVPGGTAAINIQSRYPDSGTITVTVMDSPATPWTLSLRIPEWAEGASLRVDGEVHEVAPGYATLTRVFTPGTVVVLDLPMIPRVLAADSRIDAIRGSVVVQWGPRIYCLESADLPEGAHVDDFVVDPAIAPVPDGDRLLMQGWLSNPERQPWPFGLPSPAAPGTPLAVALTPYHRWGNQGPVTMRVWLRSS